MSNKTEEHDLQHEIATKRPTVEELLRMLSGSTGANRPSPPPVPPKPKPGFEMSIEAAKRSLGLLPETKKVASKSSDVSNKLANRTFLVNSAGDELNDAFKVIPDAIRKDDIDSLHSVDSSSRPGFYENNHPLPTTETSVTKLTASSRANLAQGGSVVYISSSSSSPLTVATENTPPPSNYHSNQRESSLAASSNGYKRHHSSYSSSPIVTELHDEANNINIIGRHQSGRANRNNNCRSVNTSTVEIQELPGGGHSHDIHGNHQPGSITGGNKQALRESPLHHSTQSHRVHRNGSGKGEIGTSSAFVASNNLVVASSTANNNYGEHDDHDDDNDCAAGEDIQLAKEVETILDDSLSSQPPRTSTPTPTVELLRHYNKLDSVTTSGSRSATVTATNNNNNNSRSSRNAYSISHQPTTANSDDNNFTPSDTNSGDDTLNISRETDELTNTSALNQSGCELVGVNDNSDPKQDSSPSRKIIACEQQVSASQHDLTTPYTVQFFNDTMLSPSGSSSSPPEHSAGSCTKTNNNSRKSSTEALDSNKQVNSSQAYEMSVHELESNNLRKLVNTLQEQIEKLNNKVSGLTSKVENLESELDWHKRNPSNGTLSKSTASIFAATNNDQRNQDSSTYHRHQQSPMGTMQKLSPLSQSVSTINKLVTPMKSSRHNGSGCALGATSTYSRNSGGALSTSSHLQPSPNSTGLTSATKRSQASHKSSTYSNRQPASSQSQIRKSNMHTSTNSLYAESNKSAGSASISPTPMGDASCTINNRNSSQREYASPSSYLYPTQKRDLAGSSAYTSMLSLSSSVGNSTLRAPGSMAGSVSNLSQFGTGTTSNQLANWPSMSNFITSKHQAKDILYDEEEQIIRMVLYNALVTMRVPTWLGSNYCLDRIIEAPAVRLKLDWVHGYRGRDCRSNIFHLPTGECVYFVASVVNLYNPEERTQRHYLGHTDSVKCLAVHPNKLIIASGQSAIANRRDKRPIVRVWNTVSLATLRVIGFNEDFDRSICCLAFSKHDAGATLAVVDESSEHTITLLDWQREKNWRVAEANSGHESVLAIDFHPIDKYSLVAVGKSSINFWDVRGMTLAKKTGLFDKYDRPKYVLCMTFNDLGETITGDSNGNLIIWPRGMNKPRSIKRDVHPGGVFSVLAMKDGSYLTGGRDRRIVEWDENFEPTGRQAELPEHCGGVRFITCARGAQVLIGTLRNSILIGSLDTSFQIIVQGHTEATTALAIHPSLPKYLTGGFDDQIQFIDAETHTLEWSKCLARPVTAASFSPNALLLILGSTSGNWVALDAVTQEILFTACDGTGTINCIKFSSNGELFAMGSSDCHIYIYQTTASGNTFFRLGTCVGHSAPVKEIDWSDDNSYIQSQSMNFELLFWKAHNCRPVDGDDIVHDLKWTTHNCTIGFNVIGIWSDSIDSALINYCDKSNNDKYIVSATETGFLNIYKWPTYYNQCSSQKYFGNVEKFNFTKFLFDDSRLIAVDAKSCATTEWSIIEEDD